MTNIYDDFFGIEVTVSLVFHNDLMLARLDESCEAKDIIGALELATLNFFFFQRDAFIDFVRNTGLRQIANQHVLHRVR